MTNNQAKIDLYNYIKKHSVFNTHTHHFHNTFFSEFNFTKIISQGYVNWLQYPLSNDYIVRKKYLNKVRFKSYFVWLEKSLKELYDFDYDINENNWEKINDLIISTYQINSNQNLNILTNKCNYSEIILDAYWQPGSNNDNPNIFKSTFRVDPLLHGYNNESLDHDGNNPFRLYNISFSNLDDYVDWITNLIKKQKENGCVALKSAVAYDRGLDFHNTDINKAKIIFESNQKSITMKMIKDFQDYIFQIICELAAQFSLPLQCHTGMGVLDNTRAMTMHDIIARNPQTKFVLLHCGFPWTEDICALLHNYDNVFPDLSWLPILSYTACKNMLHQLIEIGPIDKICWGCDTRTAEESYGALLAFQNVLFDVLIEKIDNEYLSINNAIDIVDHIMIKNALELYINHS